MIEYIKGDLLKSDCDVIIHGCNCFRNMGAGIAKAVKEMYPEAFVADFETVYRDPIKLGTFSYAKVKNKSFPDKDLFVINAYTQYGYGRIERKVYANYDAIKNVMIRINDFFVDTDEKTCKIGMPKIGAGLAKGDWNIISGIINGVFGTRKVYVYEWDNGEVKKEEFDLQRLRDTWKKQLEENK